MPRGVNDHFLTILKNERKGALRAVLTALALAPVAYFMAELTDLALAGVVVWLAAGALALGVALGLLWARHRTNRYNESLRLTWNQWMRMSMSSTRVAEVARQVQDKPPRRAPWGAAWGLMVVLNGALFAALWAEVAWGLEFGAVVTALNGVTLGALAGYAAWHWRWAGQFSKALDELVAEGQVGLWGEV